MKSMKFHYGVKTFCHQKIGGAKKTFSPEGKGETTPDGIQLIFFMVYGHSSVVN